MIYVNTPINNIHEVRTVWSVPWESHQTEVELQSLNESLSPCPSNHLQQWIWNS